MPKVPSLLTTEDYRGTDGACNRISKKYLRYSHVSAYKPKPERTTLSEKISEGFNKGPFHRIVPLWAIKDKGPYCKTEKQNKDP